MDLLHCCLKALNPKDLNQNNPNIHQLEVLNDLRTLKEISGKVKCCKPL